MTQTNGHSAEAQTTEALHDFSQEVRKRADQFRKDIVKQLSQAADTLRKEVKENDKIDAESKAQADRFAAGLDKAAEYLDKHDIEDLEKQAVQVVRRVPWKAVIAVFLVGIVAGIFLRRE